MAVNKTKLISDALRKIVVQNPEKLEKAVKYQLESAEFGDLAAMQFIRDTLDGKPHQTSEVAVSGSLADVLASMKASESNTILPVVSGNAAEYKH